MIDNFLSEMEKAVSALMERTEKDVLLFHHNDTDGISAGTILINALSGVELKVSNYPLEKPYPQVLEKVFSKSGQTIIFTDFAGKIAPLISSLNNRKNLVLILDHHPAEPINDDTVFNLDGELFGLKGDRDISASATCYLFSRILYNKYSKTAALLPHIGVLGAIGDGFYVNGKLAGINREILEEAENAGSIRTEINSNGEKYFIRLGGNEYEAENICTLLDTLGGVGYYENGALKGIEVCRSGLNTEISSYTENLTDIKNRIFTNEIENIKNSLITTAHLQWINVKDRFKPMGIKMIGVFLTEIKDSEIVDKKKYLAGFQQIPDFVPGFGDIDFNSTKISMRVSKYLTEKIRNNEIKGLNSFLPDATGLIGGFSDACHRLSAATTIKIGQEEQLIEEMENILTNKGEEIEQG